MIMNDLVRHWKDAVVPNFGVLTRHSTRNS